MTQRYVDSLNRKIEILFRTETMHQGRQEIADTMHLSPLAVRNNLAKARRDPKAQDGARRMAARQKELDYDF